MFYEVGSLKNFVKFTRKHLLQSLFAKILGTLFLQNISGWLLFEKSDLALLEYYFWLHKIWPTTLILITLNCFCRKAGLFYTFIFPEFHVFLKKSIYRIWHFSLVLFTKVLLICKKVSIISNWWYLFFIVRLWTSLRKLYEITTIILCFNVVVPAYALSSATIKIVGN